MIGSEIRTAFGGMPRSLVQCALVAAVSCFCYPSRTEAGFIVGDATGNDSKPEVLAVVNAYNAANDPDLTTDFDLFKKSDDDAAFVFNAANGFMFFSDAA